MWTLIAERAERVDMEKTAARQEGRHVDVSSRSGGGSECEKEWARGSQDRAGTYKEPRARRSWLSQVVWVHLICLNALERNILPA